MSRTRQHARVKIYAFLSRTPRYIYKVDGGKGAKKPYIEGSKRQLLIGKKKMIIKLAARDVHYRNSARV